VKIIFFGTPDYVLPILKALAKQHEIAAVVTQPPKPVGRKQFLTYSPVDTWAFKRDIKILRALDIKKFPKADLGILAAYGKIIPPNVIRNTKYGILNIHPSLLPKYRGASPVQAAIAAGDTETGVTIFQLDEKVDHGPIITQFREEIRPDDTTETLTQRLFERAAQVLIELIPNYLKGKIKPKIQDETQATFTKLLKKEDGFINLKKKPPAEADRFIRAMFPWPCAWTLLRPSGATEGQARRLKLLPGGMVQLEGKNPVSLKQFKIGYPSLSS